MNGSMVIDSSHVTIGSSFQVDRDIVVNGGVLTIPSTGGIVQGKYQEVD